MMNKNRSARRHLARFLFLVPLLSVLLLGFRQEVRQRGTAAPAPIVVNDTTPPGGFSGKHSAPAGFMSREEQDFLKRHPRVERLAWARVEDVLHQGEPATTIFQKGDWFLLIYFKNGKSDMYNVTQPEGRARFQKNYGEQPPIAAPFTGSAAAEAFAGAPSIARTDQSFHALTDTVVHRVDFSAGRSFHALADTVVYRVNFSAGQPSHVLTDTLVHRVDFSADPLFRAMADTVVHRVDFSADRLYLDKDSGLITLAGNARIYDHQNGVTLASDSILYYPNNRK